MLTTKDVPFILESMYQHRSELVPCFIGAPGIGKTQGIYGFAKSKGVKVVTFILSNAVPSEVSGIRMPDNESKTLVVFDDARMASLEDGDILFFDEILEAPPMLWSSILTLVQDRIMASGRKLPDVMIVAASNKTFNATIIPPSTRDRFQWIELSFDFTSWKAWFEDTYHHPVDNRVKDLLVEDSDGYNILTPRRFTKLWEYMDEPGSSKIIADMFSEQVVEVMRAMKAKQIKQKVDGQFVYDSLIGAGFDDIPETWANMSLRQILKELSTMEHGEEIKLALQMIEVEE